MPLSLPNLDDRRYTDLVEEARSLIPSYAPEWTNHNPSDPGITLVELFAYLTEMLVYRVNRVTDDNVRAFLKLITGAEVDRAKPLEDETRRAVLDLRRTVRAVTAGDYEQLAVEAHKAAARARCLPLRNLEAPYPYRQTSAGHVSVAVLVAETFDGKKPDEAEVLQAVRTDLEPRKLLTTRLHVVAPRRVKLRLTTSLVSTQGALERAPTGAKEDGQRGVVELARDALKNFFDPYTGGPERRGWPFGRSIYVSEIYALLDGLEGVDHVSELTAALSVAPRQGEEAGDQGPSRQLKTKEGELYAFALEPDELVELQLDQLVINVVRPQVEQKWADESL